MDAPSLSKPTPKFLAPKIVINAVEGWGKTSLVAHAPDVAIVTGGNERGYQTLLGAGRAPSVDHVHIDEWPQLLSFVDSLVADPQGVKVLAFDALGGFERACHNEVCRRDFNGDWGEKGFLSFHKGYLKAEGDWIELLSALDRLNTAHNVTIVLLSHAQVKAFKNPMGEDFDRYIPDCHPRTWSPTHRWADLVGFGNFKTVVDKKGGRPRGTGGTDRILYCERRDACDAKNRYGMLPQMNMPDDPAQTWAALSASIKGE